MKTLEACWEISFSKVNFIERKKRITHPKTIVLGASKVGKSYLIYDYLSNFKNEEYVYIDIFDIRNNIEEIEKNLQSFIKLNSIKVVVIENYNFEFDLPFCDSIILSTINDIKIKGFKNLTLNALDFEEYLLHDNKHQNITNSFNSFLKYGNLPEIINIDEHKKIQRLQEIIKLQNPSYLQYEIFNSLVENIDEKKSLFQIFNLLKSKIKISKDSFYEYCKKFEDNKTFYFLKKYNQEKSTKKIYCYNHSFFNVISHNKKFKNEFSNLVFLELISKYNELYYLDNIDFYIKEKNLAIVAIPFYNSFAMQNSLKKIIKISLEFDIKEIIIVTISNSEKIQENSLKINVIPFYEWAIS